MKLTRWKVSFPETWNFRFTSPFALITSGIWGEDADLSLEQTCFGWRLLSGVCPLPGGLDINWSWFFVLGVDREEHSERGGLTYIKPLWLISEQQQPPRCIIICWLVFCSPPPPKLPNPQQLRHKDSSTTAFPVFTEYICVFSADWEKPKNKCYLWFISSVSIILMPFHFASN